MVDEERRARLRHRRHLDELCSLCASGHVGRAIDLAFEHFARDGRDRATLEILQAAVEGAAASDKLRARLSELDARTE